LLGLVFDTAALRRIACAPCGTVAELIYFADDRPSYENKRQHRKRIVPPDNARVVGHVESPV